MDIPLLFEDECVLVINKPAGVMVHGDGRSNETTLADWLLTTYPTIKDVGEPWVNQNKETIFRPGIVHRLDKETSGVMIVAKTGESYAFLKQQFQDRLAQKTYHAFVYGNIKESVGVIDKPIGKSKKDFRRYSAQPGVRGVQREAQTTFKVLGRVYDKGACYVALSPKTGRTHQLRVHMKAVHHPIVCDSLYAPERECLFGFRRLALHAHTLTIETPNAGVATFTAPNPDDFTSALDGVGLIE